MPTETYSSRIDVWLVVMLLGSAGFVIAVVGAALLRGEFPVLLAVPTLAIGVALPIWTLLGTRYVLADDFLRIRCGPFRWRIALAEITAMTRTRSPLASPALSLQRLRIDYGRSGKVMISPMDCAAFVRALEMRRNSAV